jgi:hypothetical protein
LSLVAFPKGVASEILKRRTDLAKATWRAYLWNFSHFFQIRKDQLTELSK